jgi:hypothetical protein
VLVKANYPSALARVCALASICIGGMLVEARHPSALARVCCIYVVGFFLVGFL